MGLQHNVYLFNKAQFMIKILERASSINVRKVLWVCDKLGISFRREEWGEGFKSPQEAEFKALNPNAHPLPNECLRWRSALPDASAAARALTSRLTGRPPS